MLTVMTDSVCDVDSAALMASRVLPLMSRGDSVCDVDSAALMASRVLPLMSRGDVYQQVEWVLLDAHSLLLEHQLSAEARDVHAVAAACERLSALIKRVSLPISDDLLRLQLKVSLDAQSVQGLLLISGTSVL